MEWGGRYYQVHHIIWAMHTGTWPKILDHIDGNGINNRLENMREATAAQNSHNMRKSTRNTSGFKGVSWSEAGKAWRADICCNGVSKYLGLFADKAEAAKAYDTEAKKLHADFAKTNAMMADAASSKPYLTGETNYKPYRPVRSFY